MPLFAIYMDDIFLIFGYGIPKDILKDENYNFYLKMVFNRIYDLALKNKSSRVVIICSGGRTDMCKPYKRTEAREMIKLLKHIGRKPFLKDITQNWLFIPENKSLSTLENFLNSRAIIKKRGIKKAKLYIFCEQTRERRVRILAQKILSKDYNPKVISIDFDVSAGRYLPAAYLVKKEAAESRHSLWALRSSDHLKKHHKIFQEKFAYLRTMGYKVYANTLQEWWGKKLKELEN